MSEKHAVAEYFGIKYSLRPHGWKSRLLYSFFSFVLAFGGALAIASPAQGAAPQVFVTVCGDGASWYVNGDEDGSDPNQGDRRPFATNDGLVFSPADLIHHATNLPASSLQPGSFVAAPAPDQPSFFSVEVANPSGAYGTLRWNGAQWSITIGSGGGATAGTFSNADPVALLAGRVTKWGAFEPTTDRVFSFGVGYTNSPPGTVTSLVSSISFMGTTYGLSCPVAPSPSPVAVPVPGPTKIVSKTITMIPSSAGSPTASDSSAPDPTTPAISDPSDTPDLDPAADLNDEGSSSLVTWGLGVAGVTGTALVVAGVVSVMRRRRRYQGSHQADNSETTLIPAGNDDYSIRDYRPDEDQDEFEPSLGGHAGDTYEEPLVADETTELPSIPPSSEPETQSLPPVE